MVYLFANGVKVESVEIIMVEFPSSFLVQFPF